MNRRYLNRILPPLVLLASLGNVHATTTDLATAPLVTSTALVKSNIMYVLDDSGSMDWDYLPDWANDGAGYTTANSYGVVVPPQQLIRNIDFNGVAYDSSVTYLPPVVFNADGSLNTATYPSMTGVSLATGADTAASLPNWKKVKYDGYGKQTYDSSNVMAQTCTGSGAAQSCDLTTIAYSYTFVPGQFCKNYGEKTNATIDNCQNGSAGAPYTTTATTTYPIEAKLRWCKSAKLPQTDCQAAWTPSYIYWRYPGYTNSSSGSTFADTNVRPETLAVTVTAAGTVTSIKVCAATPDQVLDSGMSAAAFCAANPVLMSEILSAPAAAGASVSANAINIATQINTCTIGAIGTCQLAGYRASTTSSASSITNYCPAPASAGMVNICAPEGAVTNAPVITGTAILTGVTTFTPPATKVPGFNVRTDIVTTRNAYVYPGTVVKAPTRTDCAGTTCTYNEEMTNYANYWAYYHTRMQMMKTAITLAFQSVGSNYRAGYMSINNNTGTDFLNMADFDITQKRAWYQKFYNAIPNNSTPLRVALATAGRYYGGVLNGSTVNGVTATEPMTISCQQNFAIASTDGYWNESCCPKQLNGSTDIGDRDTAALEVRPFKQGTATANTLADVAEYYYKTDLRTTTHCLAADGTTDLCGNGIANQYQKMVTFTLGLGATGFMRYQSNYDTATNGDYYDIKLGNTANSTTGVCSWQASGTCEWPTVTAAGNDQTTIDDLWHAAVNGRGKYFSATSPSSLSYGLSAALVGVSAKTGAAAASSTSSPTVIAGDNYIYSSTYSQPAWVGELVAQQINLTTAAIPDVDWGLLEAGTIVPGVTTTPTGTIIVNWAAQRQLDNLTYTSRNIFRFDATNATATNTKLGAFTYAALPTAQQAYFNSAWIATLTQFCSSGLSCLSASDQTAAAGANLVNFLRGDRTNEGDITQNTQYYRLRTHILGDIVSSEAAYVKKPSRQYIDMAYSAFVTANSHRQGMVYVGANDGMLHAFYASTACTASNVPAGCDATAVTGAVAGQEAWAFIPTAVMPNLYKLADKDYGNNHQFYVDGSPVVTDICVTSNCGTVSATAADWRTILVGGLNRGGRSYYALDVTDASNPKGLWEFTDTNMGYTYSLPEIGKLPNGTWVVLVTSGYNNVSPGDGIGRLYVLDATTGVPVTVAGPPAFTGSISTGVGSTTTPSGLGKVAAWSTDVMRNNIFERAYAGDLQGNAWRFDINNVLPNPSPILPTAPGYGYDAQLMTTVLDAGGTAQPITSKPVLTEEGGTPLVFFGTGRYLGFTDVPNTSQQSFYGLKDSLASTAAGSALYGNPRATPINGTTFISSTNFVQQVETETTCTAGITDVCAAGDVVRTATGRTMSWKTNNGCFVDFPIAGERVNTDPRLVNGKLVFATNIPTLATGCEAGGNSFANIFDKNCGVIGGGTAPTTTISSKGANVVSTFLGAGIATAPTIFVLPDGQTYARFMMMQPPQPKKIPQATLPGATRYNWRELIYE